MGVNKLHLFHKSRNRNSSYRSISNSLFVTAHAICSSASAHLNPDVDDRKPIPLCSLCWESRCPYYLILQAHRDKVPVISGSAPVAAVREATRCGPHNWPGKNASSLMLVELLSEGATLNLAETDIYPAWINGQITAKNFVYTSTI